MIISVILLNFLVLGISMNKLSITSEIEFQADGVCAIEYDEDRCDEFLIHKDFRYYITDQKQISHFQINIPEENCHFFRFQELNLLTGSKRYTVRISENQKVGMVGLEMLA
jgi:inorganic pyrophosphatase